MAGRSGGISESRGACEEAPGTKRRAIVSLRLPEGRCRLHAARLAGLLMKAGLFRYDVAKDSEAISVDHFHSTIVSFDMEFAFKLRDVFQETAC